MGKKKRGHYCKVCSRVLPNEKFSGKGHSRHICRKCSKKSPEERKEKIKINDIYNMARFMNLSRNNKRKLQNYLKDESKKVREAAQSIIDEHNERIELIRKYGEESERMAEIAEQEYLENLNNENEKNDEDNYDDYDIPF